MNNPVIPNDADRLQKGTRVKFGRDPGCCSNPFFNFDPHNALRCQRTKSSLNRVDMTLARYFTRPPANQNANEPARVKCGSNSPQDIYFVSKYLNLTYTKRGRGPSGGNVQRALLECASKFNYILRTCLTCSSVRRGCDLRQVSRITQFTNPHTTHTNVKRFLDSIGHRTRLNDRSNENRTAFHSNLDSEF